MISAEWGSMPSLFRKCITPVHPNGPVRVRPPSRNPLKLSAPLRPVSPATSWKVAVLVALSTCNHDGSTAGAGAAASPCARTTTGDAAPTATATINAPDNDFTVAKLPRPPARRKSLKVTTPLRIVAHERQAWHVGASDLPCHPRRAPDVSGILLARTETAARWGRRWRASCETALRSERVGAAYEDARACTPSPALRVSATSLTGCWLWGCTDWCAARCSCYSWPAQRASTPTRRRSRASRLLRQGSGRSPSDSPPPIS